MSGVLLPGTAQAPQVLSGYTASGAGGVGFAGSALPGPTAPYAGQVAASPLQADVGGAATIAGVNLPPGLPDTALVVAAVWGGANTVTASLSDSFATHYTWTSVASAPSGANQNCEIWLGTRSGAATSDLVGTITVTPSASDPVWAIAIPLLAARGTLVAAGNGNGESTTSGASVPMGSISPTGTTVIVGALGAASNISPPTTPSGLVTIPFYSGSGIFIIASDVAPGTYNPTATSTSSTAFYWSSCDAAFE